MSEAGPLISVVMSVYNSAAFLEEAVRSVQAQTREDWELIAVDDCSADDSIRMLERMRAADPRIRIVRMPENAGAGAARDVGMQQARGQYLAIIDSDDIAFPERFQKQLDFLREHPDVVIVGTQAEYIDEAGSPTGLMSFPTDPDKLYRFMYRFVPLLLPTVMINRSLLPEEFDWFEGWPFSEDSLLFFKLLQYGKLANVPDMLLQYRQHASSVSAAVPRESFFKTREARKRAVSEMNYRPRLIDRFIETLQYIAIRTLPDALLWRMYRLVRTWMIRHT